jgi:hypothetical protein
MGSRRAKLVYRKMSENVGKKPLSTSAAMRAVGYSPSYSENPQRFLATKTAKELEKLYLPDELIAMRHAELLGAAEIQHYVFPKIKSGKGNKTASLTNAEIKTIVESVPGCRLIYVKRDFMGAWAYFQTPDCKSRKDAIDMAYKRKGTYSPEKIDIIQRKYQSLSNAELMEYRRKLIEKIRNKT